MLFYKITNVIIFLEIRRRPHNICVYPFFLNCFSYISVIRFLFLVFLIVDDHLMLKKIIQTIMPIQITAIDNVFKVKFSYEIVLVHS